MITLEQALAFAVAATIFTAIPGPTVLFVVGRSLALGRTAGLLSVLGNALGVFPLVLAVAFGIGAVVTESVVVFTIIKLVGACYLVWLGVQAFRHRNDPGGAQVVGPTSHRRTVTEGFVVGISNPKTVVFLAAVLPQFADPGRGNATGQMLVFGLMAMGLAVVTDTVWVTAASAAREWFGRSPRRLARIQAGGGVMMIGLGGTMALTGSKS